MKAVVFFLFLMLCIDGFLFMGQTAVIDINPSLEEGFYPYSGTLISEYDAGNQTLKNNPDQTISEVTGAQSVSEETGNIFTDIFNGIKSFFTKAGAGVKYVFGIVNAVPAFLNAINAPPLFVFTVGAMWHGITVFLLILLMFGRDT